MLGFLDESGDTGLKVASGSSRFFVVALVVFDDDNEALRCDRRIDLLRQEMRLAATYEFHFARNPRRVRESFIQAVAPYDFSYQAIALDKLDGTTPRIPEATSNIYEHLVLQLFQKASPSLNNLTLVVDKRGDKKLQRSLAHALRNSVRSESGEPLVKKVKQQESHRNNLLQLADYVAGIEGRAVSGKTDGAELKRVYLGGRELPDDSRPK